jgi:alkanesulfonate monooxygenase SsuD/methylene tetrahydromethanopterin reductase-like flavin-dependent oxidoreductase (luciferase family)
MQTGVGLPATIPDVDPALILGWARQADAGPFSSLGIIDRLVYPNYEPLITLATAAGATQHIRLATTVLLAPLRNAGIIAKQAASLDSLSGGRFTLGLGIGGRDDDFKAAPASFHDRGRRFEAQLEMIKKIWAGKPAADGVGSVGPTPARQGGPELLLGGYSQKAIARVGKWADGFITGGVADAGFAKQLYGFAEESWQTAGRGGKPRFVTGVYYALGPDASDRLSSYIHHYYAFMGSDADGLAQSFPTTPDAIKHLTAAFGDIGVDEIVFWPCVAELDQLNRLAEVVG